MKVTCESTVFNLLHVVNDHRKNNIKINIPQYEPSKQKMIHD